MNKLVKANEIKNKIIELRGQKVMLDEDLASLYGVKTKVLNQAVRRNIDRFPRDFMFKLSKDEAANLRSQIVTSKNQGGRRYNPFVFTRNGANMLSTVLKTETAIIRSIQIMRAFSALEEVMSKRKRALTQSPDIIKELSTHSKAIMQLFQELKYKGKKIRKLEDIQKNVLTLLQQMILESMK